MDTSPLPGSSSSPTPSRRGSAQSRLLAGTTQAADRYGFARLTVERIVSAAGVSRATFYLYFANVEDCFRSAYRFHAERLSADVAASVVADPERELAALRAIATFAISSPEAARLLMREGLAAGPVGLIEREQLLASLVRAVEGPEGRRAAVDLPALFLIGGAFRFLIIRLADGTPIEPVLGELEAWARAFPAPVGRTLWSRRLTPAFGELPASAAITPFRPKGPARERILRGTALAIRAKGYQSITVEDIVSAAGVSRRSFYNEFQSKTDAFIAAYELVFQQVLAASAPAFFAGQAWPERVWHAALAFTGMIARDPLLTYLGLVECYSVGPDFTLRVHDTQLAFTLFLEEGYRQSTEAESLPRAFSPLTSATIFEVAFEASRRGPRFDARRTQPLAVYIALAPFIGTDRAGNFVLEQAQIGRGESSATA